MIVGNDVCDAAQPEVAEEVTVGSVATWDIDQPVQATVKGRVVEAPFSKTSCVYFEWVIGTTTGPEGSGSWITHMQPVVGGGDLEFMTKDGRTLKINPRGELFRLPPIWSAHFSEVASGDEPTVVKAWRKMNSGAPTIREYCLKPNQLVTLSVHEVSSWLPPEVTGGKPIEDIHRRVHVRVESSSSELTPASQMMP